MMLTILYVAFQAAAIMFAVELAVALGWGEREPRK